VPQPSLMCEQQFSWMNEEGGGQHYKERSPATHTSF